jgi:hypothetical protein
VNDLQEIEPAPDGALFLNTVATLLAGRDWLDPWFVDGAGVHLRRADSRAWWSVGVDVERHSSAVASWSASPWAGGELREVLPVVAGVRTRALASLGWQSHDVAPRMTLHATTSAGVFENEGFATSLLHAAVRATAAGAPVSLLISGRGGATVGAVPAQHLFLPAGTRTLPGVGAATLAGSRFAGGSIEAGLPLGRLGGVPLTAHTGLNAAVVGGRDHVPAAWAVRRTAIARAAATFGVSAFGGIVRIDWSQGLPGRGEWRVVASPGIARLM